MDGQFGMYAMHGLLAVCAVIILGLACWLAYVIITGGSAAGD